MRRISAKRLLSTFTAIAALPFAAIANPIITNVVETGGDNEATDTVTAKWTGVTFSNGISGEFLNPFTVPVFGEDVPAYVDRTHQWNGATVDLPLPNYLVGGEYIMIGNDNRDNNTAPNILRLDVTVSEDVLVYILIDNRLTDGSAGDPPQSGLPLDQWTGMTWLATNNFAPVMTGWNRTADPTLPDEVGVDEGGDGTGPGNAINNYSSVYVTERSAGTFSLYQSDNAGRNMYGVVIKRKPGSLTSPPVINLNAPTNNTLFYAASGGLNFNVTTVSPNSIAPSAITLSLNGTNVTGLNVTGTSDNRAVAVGGLAAGVAYRGQIIATDQAGRSSTNDFSFDTFDPATVTMIEAEDYNYGGGQTPATIGVNSYTDQVGTPGVDYFDQNVSTAATIYRQGELVGLGNSGDVARDVFTSAGGTDYVVNQVDAGEWLNYTRTIAAGNYRIYLRASSGAAQRVQLDKVTGATTANQTLSPLGVFNLPAAGFSYTPLTDVSGNRVVVTLGGDTTLRLTALSAALNLQLNYILLVPTTDSASPAYVASNGPLGANVSGDAAVTATVVNGSTTAAGAQLLFDDTDVTAQATVAPNASGFVGTFEPAGTLPPGSAHTVRVILTDTAGTKTTNDWSFTVGTAVTLPTNIKTASGTGTGLGFNVHIFKIANGITLANTAARAEQELAGQIVDSSGVPYDNEAAGPNGDGLSTNLVLNFQQAGLPAGYVGGDEAYPYIDPNAFSGDPNGIAMEATAYLDLAAGMYRFGVRSDDGFRLTAGPTFSYQPQLLGFFEGGRGDGLPGGATEFNVLVTEPGLYPVRLIYYEGTGGASLEFYTVDPVTLKRTLVNAPDSPVKAYTGRTTQIFTPTISITAPADKTNYPLNASTNIQITADAAVQGGTIVKVEFFAGTNKLGEDTTAPFTITWPNAGIGSYAITAKATDNNGFQTTSAKVNISVGTPLVRINFQAATATTPDGYLADLGDIFGDRGNGYNYGWDDDNTANARDRNSANSPNELYDTFNHMQKPLPAGRVWEIEIANGSYYIYGVSGDPDNFDSTFDVQAEDQPFIAGAANTNQRFFEGSATVTVADGKLTLTNGPNGANNKINFIDIYNVPQGDPTPPQLAVSTTGANLTVTWTGGGVLQYKTDLGAAAWIDTGNSSGSFTEAIPTTSGAKFFRVVK